ncbi:MAG: TIGR01212 family radical SAM protein [Bacillota bacterium]|nr:TIGR01212 family radical SAM protein [Bacillota bacterium]
MNSDYIKSKEPGWYYRLSSFFREKFGGPVYKIPLDAGFSCPNRDGTIGEKGCIYCYNPSFSPFSKEASFTPLAVQLSRGKKKSKGARYIAYFQAYTNTYAPLEHLKSLYDQALAEPEVIGLSIATRPDCITDETLNLLEEYASQYHIWIEYGLQSAHDKTLQRINRGHKAIDFEIALTKTKNRGIYSCAHIILGLPGETEEMFFDTIHFLNKCAVDGVKFHHLQVVRNTPLAEEYQKGKMKLYYRAEDYIPILCDCLERLSPEAVIHRLASQSISDDLLIAPQWSESAGKIASMVENELIKRGTHQGYLFNR